MRKIIHFFRIHSGSEKLYAVLTTKEGLSGWWSESVTIEPATLPRVHFRFAGDFNPTMQVTRQEPNRQVDWKCIAGHDNWQDNEFSFILRDLADGWTSLLFTQDYASELSDEVYGSYNYNWGWYLASLKQYCETGKGKPFQTNI